MKWKKQDCPFCNGNGKAWLSHDCPSGYKYKTCDHEELDEVMYSKLEKVEKEIVHQLDKNQLKVGESTDFSLSFSKDLRKFLNDNITITSIYQLFPYSSPKYDSDKALIEIQESTNNLNTRLSNLKKINKSLIRFQENSSSLNWEELQKISVELEDDYKDN